MVDTIKEALDRRALLAHVALPGWIDELLESLTCAAPATVPDGNDVTGTVTLAAKKSLGFLALDLTPPPTPVVYRLITDPAAHSFRFWLALNSVAPARKVFDFAAGAVGVALKPATKQTNGDEETLVAAPGDVSISGLAVALLIEGSPSAPASLRLSPTIGAPPSIVELQLVPPTVMIGNTGFGFEFPPSNGVPGAFVIDDSDAASPSGQTQLRGQVIQTRADTPAWRGLAIRHARFYVPAGAPLIGGHAVDAYIEVGTAPGEGIDLAIATHIPPNGTRPGIDVTIECRDPAAKGLQDFIPTLVEAAMELPLDNQAHAAPGGGFTTLAGKPVIARLRFTRSTADPETRVTLAVESQGPDGVLSVVTPGGGPAARIAITTAALATALVADKAPPGADSGAVVLHTLLAAAVGLSTALKDKGRLTINKVELSSSGHGLPVGGHVKLLVDYSVDVLVRPISVGVLSVEMRDEQPMRVRNRNVGLRLNLSNPAASGLETVELDFSGADMEIEDPGGWKVNSPASLFDILGTRSGRGSMWLEVDLRFKLNLGPIRVSGATIRATVNENGTVEGSLRGLDATLEIPGVIEGRGAIALTKPPPLVPPPPGPDERIGFSAALDINLILLNLAVDGMVRYEEHDGSFLLFIQIGVDLPGPIPLANTGIGMYGIGGSFAVNAKPKPPGPADPDPIGYQLAWDPAKNDAWKFTPDNVTFGARAVIGTVPDLGFTFSTRVGLFITVPDVAVRGAVWATVLSPRMRVNDVPSGGPGLSFLGVVVVDPDDGVTIGLKGRLDLRPMLEITIPLGAHFPTTANNTDDWYIYLGTDGYDKIVPSDGRALGPIRVEVFPDLLGLRADAYLMFRGRGIKQWPRGGPVDIQDGLVIAFGFGFDYTIGVKPLAWAEVHASADILIATRPLTLAGFGTAGGSLNLGPFSIGVDASLSLLIVTNADPYLHARLCGHIDLFFTEIEGCVEMSINSLPSMAVPLPDVHPLDNIENGNLAGHLAYLIDDRYRRIAELATTPAAATTVWPDTLLHLSFAISPFLKAGFISTTGATKQFAPIETYPIGVAAQPVGGDMLKYEWSLTSVALFDVTADPQGAGTLVDGEMSAAWQVGKDGDLGKRPQAGDLVLLTYQGDLHLNRLADGGAKLPTDPIAAAADACHHAAEAVAGWAVGYVATMGDPAFLLPSDPIAPDPCVSRFTATLTEGSALLGTIPLNVRSAPLLPPPLSYSSPVLEVFDPPTKHERPFNGALILSILAPAQHRRLESPVSARIVPDVPLTRPRLWVIVDAAFQPGMYPPVQVNDNRNFAWTHTAVEPHPGGRTAIRFEPRAPDDFISSVQLRWPVGLRVAICGLGGITAAAIAAAAARTLAAQAEAARQAAAAAKQPQGEDDTKGTGIRCVLEPGKTYRLDVAMEWEGWIFRQDKNGTKQQAGHLANQTTYQPKGAGAPLATTRSYFFKTTPKRRGSLGNVAMSALPQYGQLQYVEKLHRKRDTFEPEMLTRFLRGYTPGETETARFCDDPLDAHFSAAHVTTLAKVYGFTLKLGLRRVDVPGNDGLPIELNPIWAAIKEPKLLTGVDQRRFDIASTALCAMPKPGGSLSALHPLTAAAWYEVYVLAKADPNDNVLDGRLDGVTFKTSRWRNPAGMLQGIGFTSPAGPATGDIELRRPMPALAPAIVDGSDADFEAALDALGLDGWSPAGEPRVSILWLPQNVGGAPSWLCAGLFVESPEPVHRPGRVHLSALDLVMASTVPGVFNIRRSDRSQSRMLWLCSSPFAPQITVQSRSFFPPRPPRRIPPTIAVQLVDVATGAVLTGSIQLPLAPSFAEEA